MGGFLSVPWKAGSEFELGMSGAVLAMKAPVLSPASTTRVAIYTVLSAPGSCVWQGPLGGVWWRIPRVAMAAAEVGGQVRAGDIQNFPEGYMSQGLLFGLSELW